MKIVVIGAGYVGTVTAACLASVGHDVTINDINVDKINTIAKGFSPILEPDLDGLIKKSIENKKLSVITSLNAEILLTDVVIICVATPSLPNGFPSMDALHNVLDQLYFLTSKHKCNPVIAIRSTVFHTAIAEIEEELQRKYNHFLDIVMSPEFLRESTAVADFFHPPFIVVGGNSESVANKVLEVFKHINAPKFKISRPTASLIKYSCNIFHATKITFANEIAALSARLGADPLEIMEIFRNDDILNCSPAYLRPGFAFGGSCLPKDLRAISAIASQNHQQLPMLQSLLLSNKQQIENVANVIIDSGVSSAAMLGLSFKSGSDDLRESPYLILAEHLLGKGIKLKIYDPDIRQQKLLGSNMEYVYKRSFHILNYLEEEFREAIKDVESIILCKDLLHHGVIADLSRMIIFDIEYYARKRKYENLKIYQAQTTT